jgi:putative transposase
MPSLKIITPISGGNYYHIFNRGINRQTIFFNENNFRHFLSLIDKFLTSYVSVLAYCLIQNHFHLVIKVKEKIVIDSIEISDDEEIGKIVSNQFRKLFIAYSMALNIQEKRTGSLFDKNFKRIEITENEYLKYAIFYTHYNPEKHGISTDFRQYKYSSYSAIINNRTTKIDKETVLEIFDGKDDFINYHSVLHDERDDFAAE